MKYLIFALSLLAFACVETSPTSGEGTETTAPTQTDGVTVVVKTPELTSELVSFKGITFKTSRR